MVFLFEARKHGSSRGEGSAKKALKDSAEYSKLSADASAIVRLRGNAKPRARLDDPRGYADRDHLRRQVLNHDSTGAYHGVFTNLYARDYCHADPQERAAMDGHVSCQVGAGSDVNEITDIAIVVDR